jgi:hypothetical protein
VICQNRSLGVLKTEFLGEHPGEAGVLTQKFGSDTRQISPRPVVSPQILMTPDSSAQLQTSVAFNVDSTDVDPTGSGVGTSMVTPFAHATHGHPQGSAAAGSAAGDWQAGDFVSRHIGPNPSDIAQMLATLGLDSLETLIDKTVPSAIRLKQPLQTGAARGEYQLLQDLQAIAQQNKLFRSYIGMGYHNCITPPVIQRNILENPGWYTQYTPYQPEISQGRLEALLNFQTMVSDLTSLPISNASLLDEATAAAEAMAMSYGLCKTKATAFWVSAACHPQTIDAHPRFAFGH